jgi:hypothetical protein
MCPYTGRLGGQKTESAALKPSADKKKSATPRRHRKSVSPTLRFLHYDSHPSAHRGNKTSVISLDRSRIETSEQCDCPAVAKPDEECSLARSLRGNHRHCAPTASLPRVPMKILNRSNNQQSVFGRLAIYATPSIGARLYCPREVYPSFHRWRCELFHSVKLEQK